MTRKINIDSEVGKECFCNKCGEFWPATPEFFYRDKRKWNGLSSICKACTEADPKRVANKNKWNQIIHERRKNNVIESM